jgi:hypothetical protein
VRILTIAAVIAVPAFAQTAVYSWEDADGVHYTDDPGQVPKQQKRVETMQVDAVPSPPAPTSVASSQQPATTAPGRPSAGEPFEQAWRERFITANRRIKTLREQISALEATLPPRTECIAQPLIPVGTVQVGSTPGAPIVGGPGTQVVTANGVTTVVNGQRVFSPTARCQVNGRYDAMRTQIAEKNVELRNAELDLEQLDRQASYDSVPREWRRGW